jgi:hypothetical protein
MQALTMTRTSTCPWYASPACLPTGQFDSCSPTRAKAASPWHVQIMRAMYRDKPPKLVGLLRNPIDRIHSAFYGYPHYGAKFGHTPEGFLQVQSHTWQGF